MLLSGKKALVIGYGDVGKGSAESLAQQKMIIDITEVDPICAMQACLMVILLFRHMRTV